MVSVGGGRINPQWVQAFKTSVEKWVRESLPEKRWFGVKTRRIADVTLEDLGLEEHDDALYAYCFVEVRFEDGSAQRFFIPLVGLKADKRVGSVAFSLPTNGGAVWFCDLVEAPERSAHTLELLSQRSALKTQLGEIRFHSDTEKLVGGLEVRPSGIEQSNVSLFFDKKYYLKQYRHLVFGPNPDLEVPRHLNQVGFGGTPRPLGYVTYSSHTGEATLMALFEYVDNLGDGWKHFTGRLVGGSFGDCSSLIDDCALLGELTANMHLALSQQSGDGAFDPEPATRVDIEEWRRGYLQTLRDALGAAQRALKAGGVLGLQEFVESAGAIEREVGEAASEGLLGLYKIRIHGDYHLGQVLRTANGYVVIDFEGEPLRSLEERTRKWFALKDVAGMTRSISYAAGYAASIRADLSRQIGDWADRARQRLLDSYWQRMRGSNIIPHDRRTYDLLVKTFETEKALYELRYELENRPGWVHIPLGALRRHGTK